MVWKLGIERGEHATTLHVWGGGCGYYSAGVTPKLGKLTFMHGQEVMMENFVAGFKKQFPAVEVFEVQQLGVPNLGPRDLSSRPFGSPIPTIYVDPDFERRSVQS